MVAGGIIYGCYYAITTDRIFSKNHDIHLSADYIGSCNDIAAGGDLGTGAKFYNDTLDVVNAPHGVWPLTSGPAEDVYKEKYKELSRLVAAHNQAVGKAESNGKIIILKSTTDLLEESSTLAMDQANEIAQMLKNVSLADRQMLVSLLQTLTQRLRK